MVDRLQCMNKAAVLREIGQFRKLLFVNHIKTSSCAYRQNNAEVEQVVLFKLSYRILVDARAYDILLLVQTIILVYKMAELVLDELWFVREIFDISAHKLTKAQMLIESC